MLSFIFKFIGFLISFVYPTIGTFKALRSLNSGSKGVTNSLNVEKNVTATLKPWLVYWLMFSLLSFFEANLYFLLQYVPFYDCIFRPYLCLWLILPQTQGAVVLYQKYFEPFMDQHIDEIEDLVSVAGVTDAVSKLLKLVGIDIDRDDFFIWNYVSRPVRRNRQTTTTFGEQLLDGVLKTPFRSTGVSEPDSFMENKTKDIDMLRSFGGVLEFVVTRISSSNPTIVEAIEDIANSSNGNINDLSKRNSESSVSVTDFDLIGKEELASLKGSLSENQEGEEVTKKASWFGSWANKSSSTGYSPLKTDD